MYCVHSIFSLFTFFHLLETWELNSNGINKHIPQYLLCLEDCIFWAHKYLNTGHHQLGQNYHINVARKKSVKPSITFLTCLVIGAFLPYDVPIPVFRYAVCFCFSIIKRMRQVAPVHVHWSVTLSLTHTGPTTYALIKTFNYWIYPHLVLPNKESHKRLCVWRK